MPKPPQPVLWMLVAVIAVYLLIILGGASSCIAAWFMGMDVEGCQGAFERPMAAVLAAVTALWAAEYAKKNPPKDPP